NHNAAGRLKDMATNLKSSQGFAMNIISEAFIENANATAVDTPPEFDEWALSGLTKDKCVCNLISGQACSSADIVTSYKLIDIMHPVAGKHNSMLILAHIKYFHV
ncbi:uncharacterized protein F5147DRAFT_530052, partial [Suillus discolor]